MTLELLYHSNIDPINQVCSGKGQQSCFDGQTLYHIASIVVWLKMLAIQLAKRPERKAKRSKVFSKKMKTSTNQDNPI